MKNLFLCSGSNTSHPTYSQHGNFLWWGSVSTLPAPKLKDHPLLIVHSLNIVATILHVWMPFPQPCNATGIEAALDMDYNYIQQHHSTKKGDIYQAMCRKNMFGITELFPAVHTFMGNEVCQAPKKVPAHLAFINQVTLISQQLTNLKQNLFLDTQWNKYH